MNYCQKIEELIRQIDNRLIDLSVPRERVRRPTDVNSEFVTNKEQGDWAERVVMQAINSYSSHYVAVKYGKSDNVIAGEEGFADFYEQYQNELDTIGKRPDLLLFRSEDYDERLGTDISSISHNEIDDYVRKAIAGIEVRSSSFLIDRYNEVKHAKYMANVHTIFACKNLLLNDYRELMENHERCRNYLELAESITEDNLNVINFNLPVWGNTGELIPVKTTLKQLKKALTSLQKQPNLSITPKVEDLKVVYKWIKTFNVPHFYFQVFFDKVYGISFEQILSIVVNADNEGKKFEIGGDPKNQNKKTIKVYTTEAMCIASRVDEPQHFSDRREMAQGRLLFYVKFEGGTAYLDTEQFKKLLNLEGL